MSTPHVDSRIKNTGTIKTVPNDDRIKDTGITTDPNADKILKAINYHLVRIEGIAHRAIAAGEPGLALVGNQILAELALIRNQNSIQQAPGDILLG